MEKCEEERKSINYQKILAFRDDCDGEEVMLLLDKLTKYNALNTST